MIATATIDVMYGKNISVRNVFLKRKSAEFNANAISNAAIICGIVPRIPMIKVFLIEEKNTGSSKINLKLFNPLNTISFNPSHLKKDR